MLAFFQIKNSRSVQLVYFESNMMSKLDVVTCAEVHFQVKIREGVKKKPRCSSYIYNIFTKYLWMILFNCSIMITGSHLRKHLSSHQLFVVKILIFQVLKILMFFIIVTCFHCYVKKHVLNFMCHHRNFLVIPSISCFIPKSKQPLLGATTHDFLKLKIVYLKTVFS